MDQMNSLSWMIYLASVMESLDNILTFAAVMSGLSIPFAFIAKNFADDFLSKSAEDVTAAAKARALRIMPIVLVAIVILNALLPGKETIYAIAASEYGEDVLQTPEASKARAALNAWLDKQITPTEKVEK
jgi:hypothetical protein